MKYRKRRLTEEKVNYIKLLSSYTPSLTRTMIAKLTGVSSWTVTKLQKSGYDYNKYIEADREYSLKIKGKKVEAVEHPAGKLGADQTVEILKRIEGLLEELLSLWRTQ